MDLTPHHQPTGYYCVGLTKPGIEQEARIALHTSF